MNLKKVFESADEFNSLSDDEKKLYADDGKGKWTRNDEAYSAYLEAHVEDQRGLKKNYDRLNEDVKKLRAMLKEKEDAEKKAQEDAKRAQEEKELEAQKKANDFDGYKASVEKKHAEELEAALAKERAKDKIIESLTVEAAAKSLAAELAVSGSNKLLEPLIKSRLRTKFVDDTATVEVLDEQGRPTAYTVEDLKKQIASDPSCARIIKSSDATGGGHTGAAAASSSITPQGGAPTGSSGASGAPKKYETDAEFLAKQQRRVEELNKKNGVI